MSYNHGKLDDLHEIVRASCESFSARLAAHTAIDRAERAIELTEPSPCGVAGHTRATYGPASPPPPNELMGTLVECAHQTPYYSCATCQKFRCRLCESEQRNAELRAQVEQAVSEKIQQGDQYAACEAPCPYLEDHLRAIRRVFES